MNSEQLNLAPCPRAPVTGRQLASWFAPAPRHASDRVQVKISAVVALLLPVLFSAVLLGLTGCGYATVGGDPQPGQSYQWRSLYREDVRTVAVPIFQNKSFRRGLEFSLTQAVIGQIESKSPYKVVPKERADTILDGEIVDAKLQNVSQDSRLAIPQEQLYVITVDFIWKDLRTGKILTERRNFQQTSTFYPTLGEGEAVGSQSNVEKLAVGIVQELQSDW